MKASKTTCFASIVLALAMMLNLMPSAAFAQKDANEGATVNLADTLAKEEPATVADTSAIYVSNSGNDSTGDGSEATPYATITKAYTAAATGDTIYLLSDLDVSAQITFGTNKTVTITSADSSDVKTIFSKIAFGYDNKTMMTVTAGEVIFKNITIDGTGQRQAAKTGFPDGIANSPGCIYVTKSGATATLDTGTTIQNFWKNSGSSGGSSVLKATIGGAQINIKDGALLTGCVLEAGNTGDPSSVISSGTGGIVYMTGGLVTGNTLSTTQSASTAIVNIGMISSPHFWMTGGTIAGNTINNGAAAVYMRGEANACDMQFGDTAYVYDNYVNGTSGDQRNIYLKNNNSGTENSKVYVKLCSALTSGAKLGVYAEMIGIATKVAQGGGISEVGTGSYTATAADTTYFVSDKETGAEILYCGGNEATCGLLAHRDDDTNHNDGVEAIYLSVSPAVTATKNASNNDQIDINIDRCTSDATYVVLDKDMKPVTGKTLTGGEYVTDGNGTIKLTDSTTTTTINMQGLPKSSGPYSVMLVGDGGLTVDSTTGKASTDNLTDIATVNIVNFAGDGVTWSDGTTSFESGSFDIVTVPHNDQNGKANKTYTVTTKDNYNFAASNAVTASGNLGKATIADGTDGGKTVNLEVPAYGTTEKGTANYSTVTLTGAAVFNSGVKLLTAASGEEMTDGKTYDGAAVAHTDASIDGATLTYTWQKVTTTDGVTTYTDLANAPSGAGNYNLKVTAKSSSDSSKVLGTQNLPFTISPKTLTMTATANNKTYDGNVNATVNAALVTSGVVGEDVVTLVTSSVSATFDNKNVDTDKTVTLSGDYTLGGADAANYTLTQPTELKANITAKTLTVNVAVADKTYDGLNAANFEDQPTLVGLVEDDVVTLTNGTPTFASVNAAQNVAINFTDFQISGADATNYTLTQPTGITANIDKRELTITGASVTQKQYDGTDAATVTSVSFDGLQNGDVLTANTDYTISNAKYDGVNATGEDAATKVDFDVALTNTTLANNYKLQTEKGTQGSQTIEKADTADKTASTSGTRGQENTFNMPEGYMVEGANIASITITQDDNSILARTPSYEDNKLTYTLNSTAENGQSATTQLKISSQNYKNYYININIGVDEKEEVAITIDDATFTYNATPQAPTGITVENDLVPTNELVITYVGTGSTIYPESSTAPTDAGTYSMSVSVASTNNKYKGSATKAFIIAPKEISATLTAENKIYDGSRSAQASATLAGVEDADKGDVEVTVTGAAFNTKDADNDKQVSATVSLSGSAAKNYTLEEQTVSAKANITPKEVSISGAAVNTTKVYDGNTDATIVNSGTLVGIEVDDTVTIKTGTAAYDNKNIGENKTITFSGFELEGADANNYTLTQPAATSAAITAKALTIDHVVIAAKFYDGTNKASFIAQPVLVGVVSGEDVTLINGVPTFSTVSVGRDIPINFTDFTLDGTGKGNYTLVQPTGVVADIGSYIACGTEYTTTTMDWTNQDFVVTAAQGWQVSETNTADGIWSDTLTRNAETGNTSDSLTFYVRNLSGGYISEAITKTYKIDKTAPKGMISIDESNKWQDFVNNISFNLFFKDAQSVTLTGNDAGSSIKSIEYFVTEDDLSIEQLADKDFTTYASAFGIEPDAKAIIYAKLTDNAGNVTYLRSDGVVLDATAPVISGAENGKTYCSAVTLTIADENLDYVTLDGETVVLTNNTLTLDPSEGAQTVVATDKAGNSASITVTVNDGHTWGEWTSAGDGVHHERTCEFDAEHTEIGDCTGGVATCKSKAVCEVCKASYGELDPQNHTDLKQVKAKKATSDAEGNIEYWYCDGCDKYYKDAGATKEITVADTVIAKLESSCTTDASAKAEDESTAKTSPATGDENTVLLWIVMLLVSGGAITASLLVRRKKKYNR